MPYFETPDELADHLADLLGIYEDKRCDAWTCEECGTPYTEPPEANAELEHRCPCGGFVSTLAARGEHADRCRCRVNWVPAMADRIRAAAVNETRLAGQR